MTVSNGAGLKVVQHLTLPQSVEHLNVYHYYASFTGDQADQDVIDALVQQMDDMYTELAAVLKSTITMGLCYVYKYNLGVWDLVGSGSPAVTFTGASDMLPHGVAALVRAYTNHPRVIGRKYIGGLMEGAQTGGVWSAGVQTALAAFAGVWDNTVEVVAGEDLEPGIWSTAFASIAALSGEFAYSVYPVYQRRRRPGRGI